MVFNHSEKKLLLLLILSRLFILVTVYFLTQLPNSPLYQNSFWEFLLNFGKRWDGNSYTFIAKHGYVTEGEEMFFIVFPPLFPVLIKVLGNITVNLTLSGIILANFFFVAGLLVFYKFLIKSGHSPKLSFLAIASLAFFPTSYFFSVAYPESLFLFLSVTCFYFLLEKDYLPASFLAGFAILTRPFGIVLFPAIFLRWLMQKDKKFSEIVYIIVPAIIFPIVYLLLNHQVLGDFFAFQKVLNQNWYKKPTFPWTGIIASWKRGINPSDTISYKYLTGYGEAIASTAGFLFAGLSWLKKYKIQAFLALYLTLGIIFFTSTGFILSAPRYLLSLPPFFIILAKLIYPKPLRVIWFLITIPLLLYLAHTFALAHWAF